MTIGFPKEIKIGETRVSMTPSLCRRCAVLIPAAKAPTVVTKKMVSRMRPGSVIVDIAIDQGGCIESIRPTSHKNPVYQEYGGVQYAVPNMPALVGRTSTLGLTQATEPYVAMLVGRGIERALAEHTGLARGVNTRNGKITYGAVATALGYSNGRQFR